jgi:sulfate transport system ATP-binding protein
VALARALARNPAILLLDEPFGALDARVRRELRRSLRAIHDEVGVTSILVTHDHEEAFGLADRVAILNDGRVEQFAAPDELIAAPASAFVKTFIE